MMHSPPRRRSALRRHWVASVGLAGLLTPVCSVRAQPVRSFLEIHPVVRPPVIDGKLDDQCWKDAVPLTNFTQVVPVEGAPATEGTEVRIAYDHDHLYIAVRCFDREPDKIIATQMQRDNATDSDDQVKIAFDTFFRQRDGYFFTVNPAGARTEGLIENFSQENLLWDTVWEARTRIDADGWTAEIAIPFKSLSFDPQRDTWGFNIERIIRRKQEIVRWTALSRAKPMTSLADFGELRGLQDLRQGRGLEVTPFSSMRYQDDAVNRRHQWTFKPGGDFTYNLTPSLKANATINTDFAEAEVDQRVINLSRFAFTFPEKRDFFLQDAALFRFGPLEGLDDLDSATAYYYSRRIGLSPNGQPVDILGGARLTGRIGDTTIALLDVQQDRTASLDQKNLFVGRVSTKVLTESNVGLIVTHGDPGGPATTHWPDSISTTWTAVWLTRSNWSVRRLSSSLLPTASAARTRPLALVSATPTSRWARTSRSARSAKSSIPGSVSWRRPAFVNTSAESATSGGPTRHCFAASQS